MDFLKKNYEKVLLSVVLLGLVVAVGYLPVKIASEKQKLEDMRISLMPKAKPLPPLDMVTQDMTLKVMADAPVINFSDPNRLFNPMLWQKAADGKLLKANSANIGPNALQVTKRTELYLKLTLDNVAVVDTNTTKYVIGTERQAAAAAKDRTHKQTYCTIGTKADVYTMRAVEGATADNPTNVTVVLELNDTGERVKVNKEKPYQRIDGYTVDLKYPPENKTFPAGRRVNDKLSFNGEDYKIVDISENEIVLLALSNQKKWPVKYTTTANPTSESESHPQPR